MCTPTNSSLWPVENSHLQAPLTISTLQVEIIIEGAARKGELGRECHRSNMIR